MFQEKNKTRRFRLVLNLSVPVLEEIVRDFLGGQLQSRHILQQFGRIGYPDQAAEGEGSDDRSLLVPDRNGDAAAVDGGFLKIDGVSVFRSLLQDFPVFFRIGNGKGCQSFQCACAQDIFDHPVRQFAEQDLSAAAGIEGEYRVNGRNVIDDTLCE